MTAASTSSRRTVPPGSPDASAQSARKASTANVTPRRDLAESATRLLGTLDERLSEGSIAFLMGALTPDDARELGMRASPATIAEAFLSCAQTCAPFVAAQRITGFGPKRLHFGLGLVLSVAEPIEHFEAQKVAVSGASAQHAEAKSLTVATRRKALHALGGLVQSDPAAARRLREITARASGRVRTRSAEMIAAEVQAVREAVPKEMLDDAGLTAGVLDALLGATRRAVDLGAAQRGEALDRQAQRDRLAEPCGRIYHELRALLRAVRQARLTDRGIPRVSTPLLHRGKRRAPKTPA